MTVETEVGKGSNYCSWCYPILLFISIRLVHGFLAAAFLRIQCFLKQPTVVQLKLILDTFLSQINPLRIGNQSFRYYLTPSVEQGVHLHGIFFSKVSIYHDFFVINTRLLLL
jgi:hypothetical protein